MWKTLLIVCICIHWSVGKAMAQSEWMEWKDVSTEEELAAWQDAYADLADLAQHPFNINAITKEQLEQLPFLSDKMIENILYYVYKYGPLLTKNELLGVEGMDRQTRYFLQDFIYVGPSEKERDRITFNKLLKQNKQELLTRVDFPLTPKAGYARYSEETLKRYPNRKYAGSAFYHNLRYRFNYKNKILWGLTAEKDAGEPFFFKYNRKGYDFYSGYFFLQDMGCIKALALGHYKLNFGYGLVVNTEGGFWGKSNVDISVHRFGKGISRYTSLAEWKHLQGAAVTFRFKRCDVSAFYSVKATDALVDNLFIRSFKTDGYHRTENDMKKKHTVHNQLAGCHLAFKHKQMEWGSTFVYTHFNKVLNPTPKPYNEYYPRGADFFNAGVNYKWFFGKFIFSGETAVDKYGHPAALHLLSYSPSVHISLFFMNRYFDKKYQAVYAESSFGENTWLQNEAGSYIGLKSSLLDGKLKLTSYVDIFHFFHQKYQVDRPHTWGADALCEVSYSPLRSLDMWIKYSFKDKPKNYAQSPKEKLVLPYLRQRASYQLRYSPYEQGVCKAHFQYVRAGTHRREQGNGYLCGGTFQTGFGTCPLKVSLSGVWFKTDNYDARIYQYEPGLLYSFSMFSAYGKGVRCALKGQYEYKNRLMLQVKWGCTRYADRNKIGTGTEEIQGNKKFDLQMQARLKW